MKTKYRIIGVVLKGEVSHFNVKCRPWWCPLWITLKDGDTDGFGSPTIFMTIEKAKEWIKNEMGGNHDNQILAEY